ncbi:MAG: hypothetical protein FWF00_03715 [Endomicrobia bacterium]|nr:hypothetical protein [Endomicrobiia bacterium]
MKGYSFGKNSKGKTIIVPNDGAKHVKKIFELEYLEDIKPNSKSMALFEKLVIDKFNEKTQEEQAQKETAMRKIESFKKEKSEIISLMRRNKITEDDGTEELKIVNAEIDKIEILFENSEDINVKECWDFTKFILGNAVNLWKVSDLNTRQRLQSLITPSGFYFKKI